MGPTPNSRQTSSGSQAAQPNFWQRVAGATATAYEGLTNVYMARTMADMFPEGNTTSTRPTNLDNAVIQRRTNGASAPVIAGVSNQSLIIGGLGIMALVVLAMRK